MSLFKLYMMLLRKRSCLLQRLHLVPVNTRVFLHGVYHRDPFKRLSKIHLHAVIANRGCSQYFLRHVTVQVLRQIHHSVIICIRLIQLHQCKFRIMPGIQSLVAEHTPDLVDSLQSSYDQTLQI